MRRRGVSNDLRDRGDEWPLLKVVKGLSVVVATVVDEVSMVFGSAAAPLRLATLCSQLKRGRYGLAAAQTRYAPSQRCARLQSGLQSKFAPAMRPQNTFFGPGRRFRKNPPTSATSGAKNLCARSHISHEAGKDGLMVLCLASVAACHQPGLFRRAMYMSDRHILGINKDEVLRLSHPKWEADP